MLSVSDFCPSSSLQDGIWVGILGGWVEWVGEWLMWDHGDEGRGLRRFHLFRCPASAGSLAFSETPHSLSWANWDIGAPRRDAHAVFGGSQNCFKVICLAIFISQFYTISPALPGVPSLVEVRFFQMEKRQQMLSTFFINLCKSLPTLKIPASEKSRHTSFPPSSPNSSPFLFGLSPVSAQIEQFFPLPVWLQLPYHTILCFFYT